MAPPSRGELANAYVPDASQAFLPSDPMHTTATRVEYQHANYVAVAEEEIEARDPQQSLDMVVAVGEILHGQRLSRDVIDYLDKLVRETRPQVEAARSSALLQSRSKTSSLEPRTTCADMTASGCLDKSSAASPPLMTTKRALLLSFLTVTGILNY